jgi:valyl-tRNA synthetase
MENNSSNEMFVLSKYKYINKIAKNVAQQAGTLINQKKVDLTVKNVPSKDKNKEDAELAAKLKEEKKKKMAEMCKPNAKNKEKTKFTEKVKYVNETPKGEKKDMTKPMLDSYDPAYVESAWDDWWAEKKFYEVDLEKAKHLPRDKKFIMLLPPPNVTGSLHLGHTLMGAIEDSITRWRRMRGDVSLWVPGTDHAGIATQSVVEKKLLKEQGKYRHDFTREEFLEKVWEWKNEYGNRIFGQFKKLGVSFDLSRNFFTMDEQRSEGVVHAFVNLHERGLLYRAERMVHWSCALKTAISDVEIDDLELDGPTLLQVPLHKDKYEFGVLIDFAYKLKDDPTREIVVSTTRIETMLGDVAVAVHPEDFRYKDLIGKELIHPFIPDRHIKIVADSLLVDMTFGTGAVKITPGHDPNDFACGQRHKLPIITILDDNGILNDNAGKYKGMRRYDCRNQIIKDLESLGLYRGKKANKMVLQRCSK